MLAAGIIRRGWCDYRRYRVSQWRHNGTISIGQAVFFGFGNVPQHARPNLHRPELTVLTLTDDRETLPG
jgi:hypothetical protein